MISSSKKRTDLVAILALVAGLLVFKAWVVGANNVFVMDDFTNLLRAEHARILENLKLLPRQPYGDHPVGDIFHHIAAVHFGLDYRVAHAFQLLLHAFNTLAIYFTLRKLPMAAPPAFFGAMVFGVNPMSTMCVQWTSGIYDLFAMTFAVGSLALLIHHLEDRRRMPYFTPAMLLACYVLSVRSKEDTLFLPFIWLLLMAVYHLRHNRSRREFLSEARVLIPSFIFFCAVFCAQVMLMAGAGAAGGAMANDPQSYYYHSFSPLSMALKLAQYLRLFFGESSLVLGLAILFCAVFHRKREAPLLAGILGLSFLALLPMVNRTHQLNLYAPSFSVALLLAASLETAMRKIPWEKAEKFGAPVLTALACFYFLGLEGQHFNRGEWLRMTRINRDQAVQLRDNLTNLAGGQKLLVYNLPPDAGPNLFAIFGPGDAIRLHTGLTNIQCDIDPKPAVSPDLKARYDVLINFNQGKLIFEKTPKSAPPVSYRGIL